MCAGYGDRWRSTEPFSAVCLRRSRQAPLLHWQEDRQKNADLQHFDTAKDARDYRSGAIPSSSLRSINSRNFLRAKALCTPRIGINHCDGSDLTPDEFSQRSIIALASLEIWSKARAAEPTSLRLLTRS